MITPCMRAQLAAIGPLLARVFRGLDDSRQIERNEIDEFRFCKFPEKLRVQMRTKLCQEMHDTREVALIVIGLLVPFESEMR